MTRLAPFPTLTGIEPCQRDDADPDWWSGDNAQDRIAAQLHCMRCPTREACLAWALDHPQEAGDTIWAGTTHSRRKALRREFAVTTRNAKETK
ncbi:WhiB family transcriptional regulator [Streptomyces sp. NPDC021100]|uniref:WhiB family transcriptional regulator n=1 Tax=Streptomyces sp. NPDC021100 TaxID=3365114 RepID=UPI003796D630